jgi:threonine synthase
MDIEVSSNFERLLFDLYDREGDAVLQLMDALNQDGTFSLSQGATQKLHDEFDSGKCSEAETSAQIKRSYNDVGEVLCPHSAIAVKVANSVVRDEAVPMITLATAHPAKFPAAVEAACGVHPELPARMGDLFNKAERITKVDNDLAAIEALIREGIAS